MPADRPDAKGGAGPTRGDFFLCYFETTRKCNSACPYCMSRLPSPPAKPELDTHEAKEMVLDEIARVSSNAAVAFSGGEHLLRPDACELLEHASRKGLWSFVNTNGRVLVETDIARRAIRAADGRIIFVLPLNSIDQDINRASRTDGTETVLKAADICRREGGDFFFILTISRGNLATLPQTLKFLKMSRVPVLRAPFVTRGAGREFPDLFFDAKDMAEIIHPALTGNPLAYISFTPFFAAPEIISETWDKHGIKISGLGCHAGKAFAAVGAEGGIVPCVQLLDSSCTRGNVRERPLSEVIASDPVFRALRERDQLKGKCGRCRYRLTCGGCRALAFYRTGDLFAPDPSCFFEPESRDSRSPLEEDQTRQLGKFLEFIKYNQPWNTIF